MSREKGERKEKRGGRKEKGKREKGEKGRRKERRGGRKEEGGRRKGEGDGRKVPLSAPQYELIKRFRFDRNIYDSAYN